MALSIEQTAPTLGIALVLVAAQVASGIGVLAAAGAWAQATMAAVKVAGVILLLRPRVRRIGRRPPNLRELAGGHGVHVVCRVEHEAHVRALMLQGLSTGALHLRRLERASIEATDRADGTAARTAATRAERKCRAPTSGSPGGVNA